MTWRMQTAGEDSPGCWKPAGDPYSATISWRPSPPLSVTLPWSHFMPAARQIKRAAVILSLESHYMLAWPSSARHHPATMPFAAGSCAQHELSYPKARCSPVCANITHMRR